MAVERVAMDISRLEDLSQAAARLDALLGGIRIICFWGGMGSGKTTFIKALCRHWGVVDEVTSPTFSLINEYATPDGKAVYHFDFYRINSLEEGWNIGCEEYFTHSTGRCLIEWPLLVEPLLPADRLDVAICHDRQGARRLYVNSKGEEE